MINIQDKKECCGCNACGDICPKQCISFKTDNEGFWYPEVDKEKCIDCHLCEKTCPVINIKSLKLNDFNVPINVYAAINKNMKIRWDSTSGGAFSGMADAVYSQNGYVSGALYNEDFSVSNYISDNRNDIEKLRSSKYLQSNAVGLYANIKKALKTGKKVLTCGTPCQMAALRQFLGKNFDNLIIVDFICRGVNSPKVYRKYLDSLERKFNGKVIYVKAKNKELGWRNLTRKVLFDNGKLYYGILLDDDFRRGYHTNVFCRPSCYSCKFKDFPRISDITIGDFWGIERINPNLDNNIGTSLILINSKKGEKFFAECKDNFEFQETPLEAALMGNIALTKSIEPALIDRYQFFNDLDKNTFEFVVNKYFPKNKEQTLRLSWKQKLYMVLRFTKELYSKFGFSFKSWMNFCNINLRANTISDLKNKYIIYTMPGAVFDIHDSARIEIGASFIFGNAPVKGLRMPTCLRMEKNTKLILKDGPLTRYGNHPYNLRYGAYIEIVNGGTLTIGQGAANVGLTIMCAQSVSIGNGVRIGRNVSIRDWNGPHVLVTDTYKNNSPVTIHDHVWLCSGCVIMPGVTIGEGAVVAANAIVTKDVPAKSLVAGNPAKLIKENIEWY